MFNLAGYTDIKKTISEAEGKRNGMRNLLRRVSKSATKHMHKVWKDYKYIEVNIEPNGDDIEVNIKDTYNVYDFSRRSDGFKRFISFLFLVSARTATGSLNNVLYLHDEPDTGLHPSGARHLLSELIQVSKQNYVVFSTHSIFMIDSSRIDRHYIVTKSKEITSLTEASASNFRDEEVLFNALEFSAYQLLQESNILFEGWTDKKLFEVAIKGKTSTAKHLKSATASTGFCHAQGVKDIPKISSLLEMAKRNWIVVSDGDAAAREWQAKYSWQGKWHRYDELAPGSGIVTAEDFYYTKHANSVWAKVCKKHAIQPPAISESQVTNVVACINRLLTASGVMGDVLQQVVREFKYELVETAKPSDIRDVYYEAMTSAISLALGNP
jgi:hypothetical protein